MNTRSRTLSLIAASTAALLALSGCSAAVSGQSASAVRDTLRIGLSGGVNTLDPHNTASVGSDLSVIGSIYSSLVHRSATGEIGPDAAASWEQTDPLTWTFELNPEVTFANGEPLTAGDVVWNFDRVQDPDLALRMQAFFTNIEEVTAESDKTVVIRTAQPDADLLLTLSFFYLLEPEWAANHEPSAEALGSGPYELTDYTPKGALTLQAREDYWAEPAAIATVEYADLGGSEAEVNALQAGEVDLVAGLSPKDIARFDGNEDVSILPIESSRAAFVKFNTTLEPVDDARVRQALNYAVDKQAIIDSILRGTVGPSQGQVLTENFTGYDENLEPYPHDPEKARELLAEAGYEDGFTIALEYPTDVYVEADAIVQAVAAQLEEVGVTVELSSAPFDTWLSKYAKEGNMAQTIYITQSWQTTSGFLGMFEEGSPYAYWNDAHYGELLNTARYAESAEAQDAAYAETLAYFREQAPALFLFPQPSIYGFADDLEWTPSADDWRLPYEMRFAQ